MPETVLAPAVAVLITDGPTTATNPIQVFFAGLTLKAVEIGLK